MKSGRQWGGQEVTIIMRYFRVGELAEAIGLTVRTLHHYDEIGLLTPERSASGHRLYSEADVERLQRILSLRQLGFSLDEIRGCLNRPEFSLDRVLSLHIEQLTKQIEDQHRLLRQLRLMASHLEQAEKPSAEDFFTTMEMIIMFEKYYTEEQLQDLGKRREELGTEAIQAGEQEWPRLIASVEAEMKKGTPPTDPAVQALARRWSELVQAFTGGKKDHEQSLQKLYQNEPSMLERSGLSMEIFDYINKASESL